ncbi:MAG: hypothetical protein GDA56_28335 [Hormoscilla sp. GM7CHS1pb]|nr:hypothetical protein [Hormoscilla sp. GM7CHS1pb]
MSRLSALLLGTTIALVPAQLGPILNEAGGIHGQGDLKDGTAAVLGVAATIAPVQPQIAARLSDQVAQEITVRIDGPAPGSGAIVGKRDNIYTVVTNCHVVKKPGTYTIVTHAGSQRQSQYVSAWGGRLSNVAIY